ncbi:Eco57I restriction-modification methylase domain-containing protein, partial [Deinococcus wulumuqiensis]
MKATQLAHVRVHGLGLTDDFLLQLSDRAQTNKVKEATPQSYDLPPKTSLDEAILDAWESARKAWSKHQEFGTDPFTGWVRPLLRALDISFAGTGAGRIQISETGDVPLYFAAPVKVGDEWQTVNLDRVTTHGTLRASPHGLMQGYLNAEDKYLWGIVTNGETLRLLRDNAQVTRPAYVEFGIAEMMRAEDARAFRVLWLLLHRSRLIGGKGGKLEIWNEASKETGARATDTLRDGVKVAIEHLGTGFLQANPTLNEAIKDDRPLLTELHRACLKLVYQLVFLFVTEDRDLLFARNDRGDYVPNAQTRERATHYLTRALRDKAERLTGQPSHFDAYQGWERLLGYVRTGFAPLGLPALGSHLFAPPERPELQDLRLSNRQFYAAVRALSEITVDGTRRPVNYAGLDSEELGSIYESLLELLPRIAPGPRFELQTLAGNERKTTGSYYTPSSLIELLLESALDPVIEQAVQKGQTPAEKISHLKALKVIDPACGSGHFLIAAARRIGLKLAQLEEDTTQPSPAAQRRATRTVIAHCIYGADINPMATELAKVALWLESQDAGKPLAFLDHRLRVGNSLLGTTPQVMNSEDEIPEKMVRNVLKPAVKAETLHLPDAAYAVLEGDDKKTVAELKKKNKTEREDLINKAHGAQTLFNLTEDLAPITAMVKALGNIEPESLESVQAQESTWNAIQHNRQLQDRKLLADAWCAAFVLPKVPHAPAITTLTLHALKANPQAESLAPLRQAVAEAAAQYHFLHPHIEFPDVFGDAGKGGFDCVLGNPPWERIKLQEKEWFAQRVPEIAAAPNAAARTKLIKDLKTERPKIYADFLRDLRQAEGESHFIRASGRYSLTGRGDVNTYAIFSEANRDSLNAHGRMGIIVPTGIATDDTTKFFFQDLMDKKELHSLHDFQSGGGLWNEIGHARFKFCILTVTGGETCEAATFSFFSRTAEESLEAGKRFTISPQEIALLNPNTRTAPVFRSARDARITKEIYQRVPVLLNEATGENPWGISFMRMFDMSNDSGLFRTAEGLQADGYMLDGNRYRKGTVEMLPLYEAKLMHQFDHRFATYTPEGDTRDMTTSEKADADALPLPRYWIHRDEIASKLSAKSINVGEGYLIGWRDIARNTDFRTTIPNIFPSVGISGVNLMFPDISTPISALIALLNSFAVDYAARQKVGGTHVNQAYIKQFPVLPPSSITHHLSSFITPRVLELTYTAHDLTAFARDLGYGGEPFIWNDERRFWLRAELDALYFILYGIAREDVDYVMDTFPIVRRKDEAAHGSYRTK